MYESHNFKYIVNEFPRFAFKFTLGMVFPFDFEQFPQPIDCISLSEFSRNVCYFICEITLKYAYSLILNIIILTIKFHFIKKKRKMKKMQ